MEILGAIISVVECASPHVAKRWEYHRDFEKHRDALREVKAKLNSRMKDIKAELDANVMPDETEARSEVSSWLERVKTICDEIEDLEEKVGNVKFLSRAKLGRKMSEKKLKGDEVYAEGVFSEGSLIRRLPHRGDVMPTPAVREGETTFKRTEEQIWRCLLDEKVTKIGVHGMGGVGKTTVVQRINNRLLKEEDKFDKVMWVTVSNNSNIKVLQDKLARKLGIDLSGDDDDEESRAQKLRKGFFNSKRYVLILDDLWKVEHDTLKNVGIPDPAHSGCKLILTTRFLDVCRKVDCEEEIVMNLLSEVEALDLFLEKVGSDVSSNPKLEELVKQVARECARLPLAIVTLAGTMRRKTNAYEWEVTLTDLKDSSASISTAVMKSLRTSYDGLKDEKHKDCLLYCALYPEDYSIKRSLLVDQLIADGIIEDTKTRKYQVGKGLVMLTELESVCLLENSIDDEGAPSIKMHDLIRDMAIRIMRETAQRFLVKPGEELEFIPAEEYWNEDLEKVTLMENNIVEISSSSKPPKCPRISTLFLNSNRCLKSVPDNFFRHMEGLHVLNLSHTALKRLPECVADLVNLAMLLVEGCSHLTYVPCLANLKKMKRLDLSGTGIKEVPKGMEMMVVLTHLNLSNTGIKLIPDGILCNLINLQFLSFINEKQITVRVDELPNLTKLETFEASLDFLSFHSILRSFDEENRRHTNMRFIVVPKGCKYFFGITQNMLLFDRCKIKCELPILLPRNIEELCMDRCHFLVSNLSHLFSLNDETNLLKISISYSNGIEHLFHYSPSIFPLLQRVIMTLHLYKLTDLHGLVCMERARSPLPHGSFSALKELYMCKCPNVKKIFVLSNPSLPNIQNIKIMFCKRLEEIVSVESGATTISLPKLQILSLLYLPKLKSIPFEAESLQTIEVKQCPMIEEFHPVDREPYPPLLKNVTVDYHTWDSESGIKWDWNDFNALNQRPAYEDGWDQSTSEDEENESISEDVGKVKISENVGNVRISEDEENISTSDEYFEP